MGYIISIILSVVSGLLIWFLQGVLRDNKQLREEKKKQVDTWQKAMSAGVVSLLKIQLIEYHDKYMGGENIPSYVYENFDEMYNAYAALGGNGMVTRLKQDMDKLKLANK